MPTKLHVGPIWRSLALYTFVVLWFAAGHGSSRARFQIAKFCFALR